MLRSALVLMAAATIVACGGGDGGPASPNPNPGTGNGSMSARIDGAQWTATGVAASGKNGALIVVGTSSAGLAVGFGASMIQGTGTQTFGPTSAANGGVTATTMSWGANSFQGSGSVTLTTLTATRAAGTFTFTAPALTAGSSPSTRVVTSGVFDVTF